MTVGIQPFDAAQHLPDVQNIINRHLEAVVPGWTLPAHVILQHLSRNHHQPVIDPWVIERRTLCAMENGRLLAAAHLLRFGAGAEVGDWYRDTGDIAWFVAWPDELEAGRELLGAAQEQMEAWAVKSVSAWDSSLPAGLISGLPDCWPHLRQLLTETGFEPKHRRHEAIFGGWLPPASTPGDVPLPDVSLRRQMQSPYGVSLVAFRGDHRIGWCEVVGDLTAGGEIPALRGWGELSELYVDEAWRNRGLGAWLVRHGMEWLRLASCDRIVLNVDSEDEGRGAGRFYQRFGWNVLSRLEIGWGYNR